MKEIDLPNPLELITSLILDQWKVIINEWDKLLETQKELKEI